MSSKSSFNVVYVLFQGMQVYSFPSTLGCLMSLEFEYVPELRAGCVFSVQVWHFLRQEPGSNCLLVVIQPANILF